MSKTYLVDGNLDADYVDRFRTKLDSLGNTAGDVVLDLSRVNFIDSCGIGAVVSLHKRLLAKGRKLKVIGLRGQPLQLLINLELLPIFSS